MYRPDLVGGLHVEAQTGPGVLGTDFHPRGQAAVRHADVRLVADLQQAPGSWKLAVSMPRGRWYLRLRENTLSPEAASADTIVSPARPGAEPAVPQRTRACGPVDHLARPLGGPQALCRWTGSELKSGSFLGSVAPVGAGTHLVGDRIAFSEEVPGLPEPVVPLLGDPAGGVQSVVKVALDIASSVSS